MKIPFIIMCCATTAVSVNLESKLPSEADRNESLELSKSIQDYKYRYFIENILLYCPVVDLCIPELSRNVEFFDGTFPCCMNRCGCNDNCFKSGTCCPTMFMNQSLGSVEPKYGIVSSYTNCLYPNVFPRGFSTDVPNSPHSFFMIARCPNGYGDNAISRKCKDAGKSLNPNMDINLVIPVTSDVTNVTYRNKFCALCHGELESDLNRWNGTVFCPTLIGNLNVSSYQKMLEKIILSEKCNLMFDTDDKRVEKCNWGDVTECNVTGNWDVYDPMIEAGCLGFTLIYTIAYRNLFCYMCNKGKEALMRCTPDDMMSSGGHSILGHFEAKLNFNVDETFYDETLRKHDDNGAICPAYTDIYDSYKGKCRTVTCATNLAYIHSRCISIFEEVSMQNYVIFVRFIPNNFSFENCESCVLSAADEIEQYMTDFISEHGFVSRQHIFPFSPIRGFTDAGVCFSEILYATLDGRQVEENILSNIFYLVFHYQINMGFHDSDEVLSSLLKIESSHVEFNISTSANSVVRVGFSIKLISGDPETYITRDVNTPQESNSNSKSAPLLFHHPKLRSKFRFGRPFTCNLISLQTTMVTYFTNCPRITLDANDYTVIEKGSEICVEEINLCFESGDHSEIINGTFEVCAELYFDKVNKLISRNLSDCVRRDPDVQNCTLITSKDRSDLPDLVSRNARYLSLCSASLSIIVLIGICIKIFRMKRHVTLNGKINLLLCIFLLFAQFFHGYSFTLNHHRRVCEVIGLVSHLAWMITVIWTNVGCVNIFRVFFLFQNSNQYKNETAIIFTYLAYTFTVSALVVGINALISIFKLPDSHYGYGGSWCFIDTKEMILYTLLVPVLLIMLTNIIILISVLVNFGCYVKTKQSLNFQLYMLQAYTVISFLLCLTWTLGTLNIWMSEPAITYAFIASNVCHSVFLCLVTVCIDSGFTKPSMRYNLDDDISKDQANTTNNVESSNSDTKFEEHNKTLEETQRSS